MNVEAIGRTFKSFWKSQKEFKIRDVGNHVVLFVFQTDIDADRVLMNEPWSFDKHLVLFKRLENNSSTQKIRLCLVTVFVFYFQKLVFENIKKKQFFLYF